MDTDERMPKVAMGAWSWGAGVAGGDQVFGNHLGGKVICSRSLMRPWNGG